MCVLCVCVHSICCVYVSLCVVCCMCLLCVCVVCVCMCSVCCVCVVCVCIVYVVCVCGMYPWRSEEEVRVPVAEDTGNTM